MRYQEEALPIARSVGDEWQVGIILGNLGGAYYDRGEFARGEALIKRPSKSAAALGIPSASPSTSTISATACSSVGIRSRPSRNIGKVWC